jgi:acetoin utilization deacetylase AcuC-like enzyme
MSSREPAHPSRRRRSNSAGLQQDVDALNEMIAELRRRRSSAHLKEDISRPEFLQLLRRIPRQGAKRSPASSAEGTPPAPALLAQPDPVVEVTRPGPAAPSAPPVKEPPRAVTMALVYSPHHKRHRSPAFPEDSPDRVEAILTQLSAIGLLRGDAVSLIDAPAATIEQLRTVHSPEYVEFIRETAAQGPRTLPRSTYTCKGSWEAAQRAAGAALKAGELVGSGYDMAFALTRPAGHHATQDTYGGFCLFNNAALVARALAASGPVMIINWDVHASNGTKRIFYADPQVLTVSIHRTPVGFFPNEGFVEEIGVGPGRGFSVNVPMPRGSSDGDYLLAFDAIVAPLHRQFRPKYVVVECGFDAHHLDPLGGQRLSSDGFCELGRRLVGLQAKNLVLTLEGGYNANTIGRLAYRLVSALTADAPGGIHVAAADDPSPADLTHAPGFASTLDTLRSALGKYWNL